jgi:hypothetical protein
MKKNFKLVAILILLSPILMGKAASYLSGIESYYYVRGVVKTKSGNPVVGQTVRIYYSDSDSALGFYLKSPTLQRRTDKDGIFNILDSFDFYDNRHGAVRLVVESATDTTFGNVLFIDSAKHFEITDKPTGCNSSTKATEEVYTFPDQTITIP